MNGRLTAWGAAGLLLFAATRVSAGPEVRWLPEIDGVASARIETDEPWSIRVVRHDRSRPGFHLRTLLGLGDRIGLGTLSDQVEAVPRGVGTVVAAINGDFYTTEHEPMPGDPRGLLVQDGHLVSGPIDRDCFWITPEGKPRIGMVQSRFSLRCGDAPAEPYVLNTEYDGSETVILTAAANEFLEGEARRGWVVVPAEGASWTAFAPGRQFEGVVRGRLGTQESLSRDGELLVLPSVGLRNRLKPGVRVRIDTVTAPSLEGVRTAIGGGPALVRQGRTLEIRVAKSWERHPRSAIGWNDSHFFLVTVDGRQAGLSVGMTLPELAERMKELGCTEAFNLDGGGSTELLLRGRILNSPCYGRERRTASGLALILSAGTGPEAKSR